MSTFEWILVVEVGVIAAEAGRRLLAAFLGRPIP
jgi:hypothetical protein